MTATPEINRQQIDAIAVDYVATNDSQQLESCLDGGFGDLAASRLQSAWSMFPICRDTARLCDALTERGVETSLAVNKRAFEVRHKIGGGIASYTTGKHHVVVQATHETGETYIDPSWQQFVCDLSLPPAEIVANMDLSLQPTDRVLSYETGDIDEVAKWFAVTVRFMHEKAARGVLRGRTDMFSLPEPSIIDCLISDDMRWPAEYMTMANLEEVARRIWDPKHYTPITDDELEELATNPRQ